ncbi:phosphoribosyl-ATP diphosphatase [Faecalibaculum rodentium]|uniref:phosphoribosyl-ATP diphosphatase n=1 Tax=Faecalibaculum rodentium TaxID=1702221 RepID=UPI00260656EF|nr:phosphoribosyl-ATP diphosphatase [Faecalibaculum rodentium]
MEELNVLYETVLDRKARPEEGSYTSYLFGKGEEKILKKVGEECTEVIIASLSQSKEDLINEFGDLFYHMVVLMVEKGITLEEISAELERRSGKKHNLKAERKPVTNY